MTHNATVCWAELDLGIDNIFYSWSRVISTNVIKYKNIKMLKHTSNLKSFPPLFGKMSVCILKFPPVTEGQRI